MGPINELNLRSESSGGPGECGAVSGWTDGAVGRRVERPVDVTHVHQRVELTSFLRTEDMRLNTQRPTQLSTYHAASVTAATARSAHQGSFNRLRQVVPK